MVIPSERRATISSEHVCRAEAGLSRIASLTCCRATRFWRLTVRSPRCITEVRVQRVDFLQHHEIGVPSASCSDQLACAAIARLDRPGR